MQIQFIATVAVIIADSKSFGVWPPAQAAQARFATPEWPDQHPVPQASIEFEVVGPAAAAPAAAELANVGFSLPYKARLEPWGQTVARVLSPEGLIIGISYAPSLH
ncbi:MAG: hypothetical protein ABI137_04255 [Antricoccus sp.]